MWHIMATVRPILSETSQPLYVKACANYSVVLLVFDWYPSMMDNQMAARQTLGHPEPGRIMEEAPPSSHVRNNISKPTRVLPSSIFPAFIMLRSSERVKQPTLIRSSTSG